MIFDEKAYNRPPADQIDAGADIGADTFCGILRARATQMPNKRAFVFLDSRGAVAEELSFADLDRRAQAIAADLAANGLGGERVLLMFPPGLDFIAALFACFYAGVVAVPVPFLAGKRIVDRITSICRDSDPAGVLTLGSLKHDTQVSEIVGGIHSNLVWIEVDSLEQALDSANLPGQKPETLALLQYTSGSTHSPKGVMLSHANLMANSRMIAESFGHDQTSRGVSWLPLFHDMGLIGHVLQPVYFGGLSVLMSPLSFLQRPARWLQAISSWKATTSGGPTHAFDLCLKFVRDDQICGLDLGSWRVAYCGSEKVRADVLDRFSSRFALHGFPPRAVRPCFGLAEATLLVSAAPVDTALQTASPVNSDGHHRAVSCGWAARDTSVLVVDPETNIKLRDGTVGEIWVQGPHIAQGYWGTSVQADDPFRANLADGSGAYLRTGDLGFIQHAQLFVVGRIKDTIIHNGLKHCAEDIEASAVQTSSIFAGFATAAFGFDAGSQEHAVLVQEIGRARCDADELRRTVADALACVTREHGLRLFDFVVVREGSLPRTSSGKIQRSRARDMYLGGAFERLNSEQPVLRESAPWRSASECNDG